MRKFYDMMVSGNISAYKDVDGDWQEYEMPNCDEKDNQNKIWEDVGKHFTGVIGNTQWNEAIEKLKSKYSITSKK